VHGVHAVKHAVIKQLRTCEKPISSITHFFFCCYYILTKGCGTSQAVHGMHAVDHAVIEQLRTCKRPVSSITHFFFCCYYILTKGCGTSQAVHGVHAVKHAVIEQLRTCEDANFGKPLGITLHTHTNHPHQLPQSLLCAESERA